MSKNYNNKIIIKVINKTIEAIKSQRITGINYGLPELYNKLIKQAIHKDIETVKDINKVIEINKKRIDSKNALNELIKKDVKTINKNIKAIEAINKNIEDISNERILFYEDRINKIIKKDIKTINKNIKDIKAINKDVEINKDIEVLNKVIENINNNKIDDKNTYIDIHSELYLTLIKQVIEVFHENIEGYEDLEDNEGIKGYTERCHYRDSPICMETEDENGGVNPDIDKYAEPDESKKLSKKNN